MHPQVNLQVLDLHLNHLSDMPLNSLEPLTKLRKLHLYWNMFVSLPVMTENHMLEEVLVNGNALLDFPKYMFGNLTSPLTYHFVVSVFLWWKFYFFCGKFKRTDFSAEV